MFEFVHNGNTYRAGKLTAFQQLHVSRRIAPLLPPLIPIFLQLARANKAKAEEGVEPTAPKVDLDTLASLFQPFTDSLALMKDADAEYVISTCLSVVQRSTTSTTWIGVWNDRGKVAMFDDLNQNVGDLWMLVLQVLKDSLGPFIQGILTNPPAALSA
jgi:hypothetical protein